MRTDHDKMAGNISTESKLIRVFIIQNKLGLHARASAKFVQTVEAFDCFVEVEKDNMVVEGTSIMGLMMLAAACGCMIKVSAEGAQASLALEALEKLIEQKFHEEQ